MIEKLGTVTIEENNITISGFTFKGGDPQRNALTWAIARLTAAQEGKRGTLPAANAANCGVCGKRVALTRDGKLRKHKRGRKITCAGGGYAPEMTHP